MPGQLFYSTGIPVSLWFVNRNKENPKFRNRKGETLFIDARKMGQLVDRVHRELDQEEIKRIAHAYHAWRCLDSARQPDMAEYVDVAGFCKSVMIEEIREHEYILTPGRYVGIEEKVDDGEPFELKMQRLTEELAEQFAKSGHLEERIKENLKGIGFEI